MIPRLRSASSAAIDAEKRVEEIRRKLREQDFREDLLSALEQFSGPMLDELYSRIATIETKAINILGWSTALLGFLLLQPDPKTPVALWLNYAAIGCAVIAIGTGFEAGRARRDWQWPTVDHWFSEEEFDSTPRLRVQHLRALLIAYEVNSAIDKRRSRWLMVAQIAVTAAGLLVALVVATRIGG